MTSENLEILSRILGRCTIIGFGLVTMWYLGYMSGALCGIHGAWFGLSNHECSVMSYAGMGILKIAVLIFFFLPWLSIRMLLRSHRT